MAPPLSISRQLWASGEKLRTVYHPYKITTFQPSTSVLLPTNHDNHRSYRLTIGRKKILRSNGLLIKCAIFLSCIVITDKIPTIFFFPFLRLSPTQPASDNRAPTAQPRVRAHDGSYILTPTPPTLSARWLCSCSMWAITRQNFSLGRKPAARIAASYSRGFMHALHFIRLLLYTCIYVPPVPIEIKNF